ncbi:hypothetical protein [Glycomyces harbinensis]|nr:hypothetical protein [Glycomyces harbinensis]
MSARRLERDRVYGEFLSPEGHPMVVKATKQGVRAHVLLNHTEGPVVAEILDPVDPASRTIRFRPLWQTNRSRWKDTVTKSASEVLDDALAADTEMSSVIDGQKQE